ncbi:MAG: glycosyltransferase family 4 protein [Ekhidna sp.]|nr:glycosyltransferase family 4 protein [Ekhidna sp.]
MKPYQSKPLLILIQSTDASIRQFLEKGTWNRLDFTLSQYAKDFKVYYYTCDNECMQSLMPEGVSHRHASISTKMFGVMHILYYLYLILSAFKWKISSFSAVRVIGVNIPVLSLVKAISRKKFVVSYQYDWAIGVKKDYGGLKALISNTAQRFAISTADHLLCTMNWLQDTAINRYKIKKENTTVLPNYVNTEIFKPSSKKEKQIIYTGRLHWSKGVDLLIEAFNKFRKSNKEYRLVILGVGDYLNTLKTKVEDEEAVFFAGSVPNNKVAEYLSKSEIFVLPSRHMEGHPKSLIEAMASGCKCIASDAPGNREVLRESKSEELLFKVGDSSDLYEKLCVALSSENRSQYEFAIENYNPTRCFNAEKEILLNFISS